MKSNRLDKVIKKFRKIRNNRTNKNGMSFTTYRTNDPCDPNLNFMRMKDDKTIIIGMEMPRVMETIVADNLIKRNRIDQIRV